ncbi:MAG: hypothetical protein K0B11_03325 [Mariniphaga sp.]|nr:hypothetical protein [Mariniphaga sp.]
MDNVNFRLRYCNGHIVFVVKLADGLFQYNLPVCLKPNQWDDNSQLPVRGIPHFDQKVYILQQTKKGFRYALERLRKSQLTPTMANLSHVWGKTLEKSSLYW